jgi:hypothetical protein
MKVRMLGSVVLAIAGSSGLAYAADPSAVEQPAATCTYRAEPSTAAAPITKSVVTLLALNPAADAEVRRDTLIGFDVEYRIKDFTADTYFLMPLWATAGEGSDAPAGMSDYPRLEAAAGKVHVCVALAEMYDSPTTQWPLTIWLSLMKMQPDGSSLWIEGLRKVKFNALDIPAEALARQAEGPPIEYYDNLKKVWNFFEARLARYKVCNQRFPAGQAAMTKAYRRWEARHADEVQFVSELQFDQYLFSMHGNTARATYTFDAVRALTLRGYTEMPAESLRQQCDIALSEFSDPEDMTDNIIGDEVAYLRKWQATHKKAKTP